MSLLRNLLFLVFSLVTLSALADPPHSFGNKQTRSITVKTAAVKDDGMLLKGFEQRLKKDRFTFTKDTDAAKVKTSFNNCENNSILVFEGSGIVRYYAKNTVSEKTMKHTYADFVLTVITFPNAKIAAENHSSINKALYSGGFCNGKAWTSLIQKENKVYYFFTRAALFGTHTTKYSNYIKDFKP